jgi:hypothetical protein
VFNRLIKKRKSSLEPLTSADSRAERLARRDQLLENVDSVCDHIREAQAKASPSRNSPRLFDEHCVCAIHDREFVVRYIERDGGLYEAVASLRPSPHEAAGSGAVALETIPVSRFTGPPTPCVWCGAAGHFHCSCGAVVCGGRVSGQLFSCRDRCGRSWIANAPVTQLKGSTRSKDMPREPQSRYASGSRLIRVAETILLR